MQTSGLQKRLLATRFKAEYQLKTSAKRNLWLFRKMYILIKSAKDSDESITFTLEAITQVCYIQPSSVLLCRDESKAGSETADSVSQMQNVITPGRRLWILSSLGWQRLNIWEIAHVEA